MARACGLACRGCGHRMVQAAANASSPSSALLAALDVHPRVAMTILRYSRIALTMEIYTQVPGKVTRDALRRLSDQLDGDQADADEPGAAGPGQPGIE